MLYQNQFQAFRAYVVVYSAKIYRVILLITRMIKDWIGLHSVLLEEGKKLPKRGKVRKMFKYNSGVPWAWVYLVRAYPDSFLIIICVHCTRRFQLGLFSCFSLMHFITFSVRIFVLHFNFQVKKRKNNSDLLRQYPATLALAFYFLWVFIQISCAKLFSSLLSKLFCIQAK